jgi:flagellar motility protein MotE (MotC chaperone)
MSISTKKCLENIKSSRTEDNVCIKDTSINVYMNNIKKLFKELFSSTIIDISKFRNFEKISKYIDFIKNISSRKTMYTSVIVLLKSSCRFPKKIIKKYSEKLTNVAYQQNNFYMENKKSEKENNNWVSKEEIDTILNKLKEKKENNLLTHRQKLFLEQQYILLRLYTCIPPVRNDYIFTKIFTTKNGKSENENYINLYEKKFILQKYKTFKFYGKKVVDLDDSLISDIIHFENIKKNYPNKINHNYLIVNTTDLEPMNSSNYTKTLNKIFYPKKISSTILRKIYLSYKYPITHSMNEMQNDADIMGHDIMTARKIYTKMI